MYVCKYAQESHKLGFFNMLCSEMKALIMGQPIWFPRGNSHRYWANNESKQIGVKYDDMNDMCKYIYTYVYIMGVSITSVKKMDDTSVRIYVST